MYKVFSRLGDVTTEGDELIYRPDTAGTDEIAVYRIAPTGEVAIERVNYQVE
jgi:hypothetical protein